MAAPAETRERLEGVASDPEAILRRMLAAVVANAYDDFVLTMSDGFKAGLTPARLAAVAQDIGPRLKRGYTAHALGKLTRGGHVAYLWKLELADGGDDLLVRLAVLDEQIAGFWIE